LRQKTKTTLRSSDGQVNDEPENKSDQDYRRDIFYIHIRSPVAFSVSSIATAVGSLLRLNGSSGALFICHIAGERRSRSTRRGCPAATDSLHGPRHPLRNSRFVAERCPARLHPGPLTRVLLAANRQSRGRGRCPGPNKARRRDARSFSGRDYVRRLSVARLDVCDV